MLSPPASFFKATIILESITLFFFATAKHQACHVTQSSHNIDQQCPPTFSAALVPDSGGPCISHLGLLSYLN